VRLLNRRPARIERLRRKGDATRLTRFLTYEKLIRQRDGKVVDHGAEVRKAAAKALSEIEAPEAHDGLVRALRDPERSVRSTAIRGLQRRGYHEAARPLIAAVTTWTHDGYARSRMEALEALVTFGRPETARTVAAELVTRPAELDDADREVLRRLVEAGGSAAERATIGDLIARLQEGSGTSRVGRLLAYLAPESVEPVIELLEDPSVQREAALTLGAIRDSRATEPLGLLLLGNNDPSVRASAAWALGEVRDPAAVAALLRASSDEDYDVRAETIAAFDKLGNVAIAVAMSMQMRAALEDGVERASARLDEATEEARLAIDEDAERAAASIEARASAAAPGPATLRDVLARSPLRERARPLLRRLLREPPR
jgi:HEAT repeat protein